MNINEFKKLIENCNIFYLDLDEDQSFERGVDYFCELIKVLPNIYENNIDGIYLATNGDEILLKYFVDCEEIADLIDDYLFAGEQVCHTGYYDPEEDERSGETDANTGWYYIDLD